MEVGLAVGGAFFSSALNVFFDRMTPKYTDLFRGHNGANHLLRKLKRTLRAIEGVLDYAEEKRTTKRHVSEWLTELKDTVYHAEDLVDEINIEALQLNVEGGEQNVTNTVSHLSNEFLKKIIPKIEEVVTTLENLKSQINVFGLGKDDTKDNSHRLPSTSSVDEPGVYGRDNEREKLIQMLLSDDACGNKVSVIPIVGMGGVGKTTLTQVVFGDERVKKYFDKRAWVCVSENYDVLKITNTLVEEVTRSSLEGKDNLNLLEDKLKENLAEKKFLIILDDFWNDNPNDWDKLMVTLRSGKQGSKIIVTTRNESIAFMVRNKPIQYLELISYDDCWSLFKKHAFGNGSPFASPEFERIGKEIVKKCKGLPLAVKTLGGLLRSKTKVKEWDDIFRSEFWALENKSNDVLPVLRLSYHHLPSNLKHCFAFCAVFPKNYLFDEEELILLWMANGLLQHPTRNDKTIEDTGLEYVGELKSRSLFQKVNDRQYSMHDLVNDLAQYVCGNFCVRFEDYQYSQIPSEARHFSCISELYNAYEKFKFLHQVRSLRTFLPINRRRNDGNMLTKMFLSDILPQLRCLRVLSLHGYDINELPDSICNLKHLRCVNLCLTYITHLPDAIRSLHNLQTLLLSRCSYLDKLPMQMTKLVNLRHLDLKATELKEMPSHISRLKSLQSLSYFMVDDSPGRRIDELGKIHLHGYLKIKGLQHVSCSDALKANLRNKNSLEELILQWNGDTNDSHIARHILDMLQPHTNLKSLTIDGYIGTSFPHWLADDSFCNIVSLCLTNCMNCFSLPALGHLPSLISLTISKLGIITVGQEFYGDGSLIRPFQSLETLRIEEMSEWEIWDISGNVYFSRLEELYIKKCPKLRGELPSQLLCLKILEISGCPQFAFPADWMSISQDNQGGLCCHLPSLQVLEMSDMSTLEELPEELLRLGLVELKVQRCESLVSSRNIIRQVNKMILKDCPSLVSLPIVSSCATIKELKIENCTKLEFPTRGDVAGSFNDVSLCLFPNLLSLEIFNCENLKVFPAPRENQNLLLCRLTIWGCNDLLTFPRGGLTAPNLEYFWVHNCEKLKSLPEQMHSLHPSLKRLCIDNCPEIESFPEGGLPSSLDILSIHSCKKLMRCRRDWGLQRLPALRYFSIFNVYDDYEEPFPDEWLLPASLRVLEIWRLGNLNTLNEKSFLHLTSLETLEIYNCPELLSLPEKGLPTSLQTLEIWNCPKLQSLPKEGLPSSLKTLRISGCPELQSLSEEGLPTSLSQLDVRGCPLLTPHLEIERGKYWPHIAPIHTIVFDGELIS